MILYFSGTGNSRYVAEKIGKIADDEVVSINQCMKENRRNTFKSTRPYVFVAPVYAGRIPRVVNEFIRTNEFSGNKKAYFIVTCSETPYRCVDYTDRLMTDKGFTSLGFNSVIMPQNYIVMYDVPSKEQANTIIMDSDSVINKLAEKIKNESTLKKEQPGAKWMSSIVNPIMYKTMISAKKFEATDKCVGCGKCVSACPLNNIKLKNVKPYLGKECTHCMGCINICPHEAIEYGNKTKGRTRFFNTKSN